MPPIDESFAIEDGLLIHRVVPSCSGGRGKPYEHTCREQVFKDMAWAIEQLGTATFTGESIRESIDAPSTQVMVAMAFLKERGSIVPARERRHKAAGEFTYEDALIEWHALREKPIE